MSQALGGGGLSSTGICANGLPILAAVGDAMLGTMELLRDGGRGSPRRDVVEDFRTRAGEEARLRLKLSTLGLRGTGDRGTLVVFVCRGSEGGREGLRDGEVLFEDEEAFALPVLAGAFAFA